MASLASTSPLLHSNQYSSRSSNRPDTQHASPATQNTLQKRPSPPGHKQHPSITSNPSQDAQHQIPFPDLPDTVDDFSTADQYAYVAPADLMSAAYVDNSFGTTFEDFMTPDYSTDNHISEHTTPQEAIWEQQFNSRHFVSDSSHPHILDGSSQNSEHASPPNPTKELQSIFSAASTHSPQYISGAQLLSPRLTTPSPSRVAEQRRTSTDRQTDSMDRTSKKRGAESLHVSTDTNSLWPQRSHGTHQPGQSPNQRPVSPVIILSSHPQGDSPAHASPPRNRSLSRSHESPLHNPVEAESNQNYFAATQSSLLAPGYLDSGSFDESNERLGLDPTERGDAEVPTINQLADNRQRKERNLEVEEWLHTCSPDLHPGEAAVLRQIQADRPRAHSTGVKVDSMGIPIYSDRGIPGPGVLVDEDSEDEYSEDEEISVLASSDDGIPLSESPPVEQDDLRNQKDDIGYFPPYDEDSIPPEMQEPHPRQFYRRGPWQDPPQGPIVHDKSQPFSSNSAMMRFNEEAAKWETASRAATWGTRRRLSDSEVQSIVDGSRVRHMSLVKRGRARGSTILKRAKDKANDLIPRRSNSNIKKAAEAQLSPEAVQLVESPQPRESLSSSKPLQRLSSFGKSKSPPLDTSSAINASALAASGGEAVSADSAKVKSEGLRSPLQMLRKARSKSDVGKSSAKSSPGLQELMTQHGGPPVPNLASPAGPVAVLHRRNTNDAMDDDDDDLDEEGIKMDLNIKAETIIPNFEGFKLHARQLNPRLPPYLIDRIGQEQVRRYKKLVENRVKHVRAVQNKICPSKHRCFELGGDAELLAPRQSTKDPDATCAQFSIPNTTDGDAEDGEYEDGVVTPALFPTGIPLPPVKRIPAEFECFLCFKVKKFHKPSDWTKHVHEDVQPFSCTFPNCGEPKSFKRKADWVRHENERHRRLEYWRCSVQECSHVCYRKDNFVQHLVREHKKTEPKGKSRAGKARSGAATQTEDNEVWQLVEACRYETSTRPRDEPCRFCGNVLNSWKKLSVHMGKHMEQLAMPVLELVNLKQVTADTIISPIEQNQHRTSNPNMTVPRQTMRGPMPQAMSMADSNTYMALPSHMTVSPAISHHDPSLSPYSHSVHSAHNSSAGHSPAMTQVHAQMGPFGYGQYYTGHEMSTPGHGSMSQSEAYVQAESYANSAYPTSGMSVPNQYGGINNQVNQSYDSGHSMQTPISAQSMPTTLGPVSGGGFGPHDAAYAHGSSMGPYEQYPPTSQANGSFQDGTQQTDPNQDYVLSNQYGQQNNMYYH
ncbi:uncharacterized protein HMPREF1541_10544 [Cyphellophora europaea CBS 101466]|uniref:C2H2-type domain-containing protein n=1 Tax=Cyphellophora europaea (strain CBS 101466) TaxID=1220924 RepID=W2S8Y9_CYPE1|nr:uncharacterized protein HMPREF1541_10544 [Cyphellophora europaea CBS 101466]ETN44364.1 hypothetical protein HMPREF1541_10544 [Cyphellophora europaea CBS 101466]